MDELDKQFNDDQMHMIEHYRDYVSSATASRILKIDSIVSFLFTLFALVFIFSGRCREVGIAFLISYPFSKLFMSYRYEKDRQMSFRIMQLTDKHMRELLEAKEKHDNT